jgi:hypothetical protein
MTPNQKIALDMLELYRNTTRETEYQASLALTTARDIHAKAVVAHEAMRKVILESEMDAEPLLTYPMIKRELQPLNSNWNSEWRAEFYYNNFYSLMIRERISGAGNKYWSAHLHDHSSSNYRKMMEDTFIKNTNDLERFCKQAIHYAVTH